MMYAFVMIGVLVLLLCTFIVDWLKDTYHFGDKDNYDDFYKKKFHEDNFK